MFQEVLEEIGEEHGERPRTLPLLKEVENPLSSIIDIFQDWLQLLERQVEDALGSTINSEVFVIIILVLLATVLLYISYKFFFAIYTQTTQKSFSPAPLPSNPTTHSLEAIFKKAVQEQDIIRALRVGWRLFLRKQKLRESLTPIQYINLEGKEAEIRAERERILPYCDELYRAMFFDGKQAGNLVDLLSKEVI